MQDGFIGKASKVVLKGTSKQLIRISDTSKFSRSLTSELDGKMTRDVTAKMENRETLVEGRGGIWKGICVGLIFGAVILGIYHRFKEYRYR